MEDSLQIVKDSNITSATYLYRAAHPLSLNCLNAEQHTYTHTHNLELNFHKSFSNFTYKHVVTTASKSLLNGFPAYKVVTRGSISSQGHFQSIRGENKVTVIVDSCCCSFPCHIFVCLPEIL